MNIKRAKEEIKNYIEAYLLKDEHGDYIIPFVNQRPLLVTGPPGIGKTQIAAQAAEECGVGFVTYTVTHQSEENAFGQPYLEKRRYGGQEFVVTEYTVSRMLANVYEHIELMEAKEGVLFIDGFGSLSENVHALMRQFLQYKTFGGYNLPEGWVIVMAGGVAEYGDFNTGELKLGLLDRIISLEVEADFEVWKEYAFEKSLHPAVISYLDGNRPNLFCVEIGDSGQVFATPRGWEDLARVLVVNEKRNKANDSETIGRYVGHSRIAREFAEFLVLFDVYKSEYRIDRVLAGDTYNDLTIRILKASSIEKSSVINLLLDRLNAKFREVGSMEAYLELLLKQLKRIKGAARGHIGRNESQDSDDDKAAEYISYLRAELTKELERSRQLSLMSREEENAGWKVAERLREYNRRMIETRSTAWEPGFMLICRLFEAESGEYELLCENILSMMECAFDFLEASFGNGPEVVKFVNGLNNNHYSRIFLRDNKCERYYEYNKRLVFESKEDSLRSRLARL